MTTENKTVDNDNQWHLVTSAADFLLTNECRYPVQICFSDSIPSADLKGHTLERHDGLVRGGLIGDVYAKASSPAVIAVTE